MTGIWHLAVRETAVVNKFWPMPEPRDPPTMQVIQAVSIGQVGFRTSDPVGGNVLLLPNNLLFARTSRDLADAASRVNRQTATE